MHAGIIGSGLIVNTDCTVYKTMSIKDKILCQGMIEMCPQHYYQKTGKLEISPPPIAMGYFAIKLLCKSAKYS